MKLKFRLIKEYPNSPKLGYITEVYDHGMGETNFGPNWYRKYSEYWKPVTSDYTILSLHDGNGNVIILAKPSEADRYLGTKWFINSVKRTHDGIIFTRGQYINTPLIDHGICILYNFERYDDDGLHVHHTHRFLMDEQGYKDHFQYIQPYKK